MAEIVEQALYDQLRVETHAQLDLTKHSCAPDTHPVTGHPLFSFEFEPHKLKNLMQAIQRQPAPSIKQLDSLVVKIKLHKAEPSQQAWAPREPEQCIVLVSKPIFLAVAKSEERFKALAVIIAGATDRQNVACAEAVLCDRNFIAAVHAAGYPEIARYWCLPMGTLLQTYGEQVLQPGVPGFTKGLCSSTRYMLLQVYCMSLASGTRGVACMVM